jgi:hypothetical protein
MYITSNVQFNKNLDKIHLNINENLINMKIVNYYFLKLHSKMLIITYK